MPSKFTILGDDEVQDFHTSITRLGFTAAEFELGETRSPPTKSTEYAIAGTVTVTRKINGIQKTYPAGHMSSWPASFHDDLTKGTFGQP